MPLAAGLALALLRGGSDGGLDRVDPARAVLVADEVPKVVVAYAPVVRLHPQERFFPTSPDEFLANAKLVFFRPAGGELVAEELDAARLGGGGYRTAGFTTSQLTRPYHSRTDRARLPADQGFALDLVDSSRCAEGVEAIGCAFEQAPVYYDYAPGRYVTYWLFYAYSAPAGFRGFSFKFGHEGDWERVVVLLDVRERPLAVAYYQHEGPPQIVPWGSASIEVAGSRRPVVYAARGTHASYPAAGEKDVMLGDLRLPSSATGPRATFSETRAPGTEWSTWLDLREVKAAWFGYGGAWGNRGRFPFTTGPLGPSRWKDPAPCTRRIAPPCTPTASPNARVPFAPA